MTKQRAKKEKDQSPKSKSFSGIFSLQSGQMLALQAEVAEQLIGMMGKPYKSLRAELGVSGANRNTDLQVEDGIATLSLIGPIARYDNICTAIFGGISVESLMDQLKTAAQDRSVTGILLVIDSPGGDAAGIYDLATMVRDIAQDKPVVAYVDALAASAAYWIASGASEIVMSPAAAVGSIGVVTSLYIGKDDKRMEMVSSQSPKKRPDVTQDEGRAVIQERIDDLAGVFVQSVADHRGVSTQKVLDDFGQGGVVTGAKAVDRQMADSLGNLDTALAALERLQEQSIQSEQQYQFRIGGTQMSKASTAAQATSVAEQPTTTMTANQVMTQHPEAAQALIAKGMEEGAVKERARIEAIRVLDTQQNRAFAGDLIDAAYKDGKTDAKDLAYSILQQNSTRLSSAAEARRQDGASVPVVKDGGTAQPVSTGLDAENKQAADGVAAYANSLRTGKKGK
jgi:signal peptide peptidase SppA